MARRVTASGGFRFLRRLRRRLGGRDAREPGAVNHVSLGSHCHAAQILKETGLRTWSGPFDWIFSSPGMVRDCLADDFAALLDRSQYESTPLHERTAPHETRCRHRLYRERHAIPFVFNHHDPAASAADDAFLREGVRRMRAALDRPGAENRFYLLTALPCAGPTMRGIRDLLAARRARNRLVVLQLRPAAGRQTVNPILREPGLDWVRIETLSPSVGLRFAEPTDDAFVTGILRERAALPAEP